MFACTAWRADGATPIRPLVEGAIEPRGSTRDRNHPARRTRPPATLRRRLPVASALGVRLAAPPASDEPLRRGAPRLLRRGAGRDARRAVSGDALRERRRRRRAAPAGGARAGRRDRDAGAPA